MGLGLLLATLFFAVRWLRLPVWQAWEDRRFTQQANQWWQDAADHDPSPGTLAMSTFPEDRQRLNTNLDKDSADLFFAVDPGLHGDVVVMTVPKFGGRLTQRALVVRADEPTCYVGLRTAPTGEQMLIRIQVQPEQGSPNLRLFQSRAYFYEQRNGWVEGVYSRPAFVTWGIEGLQIFEGVNDPNDPARFTITCEHDGYRQVEVGTLEIAPDGQPDIQWETLWPDGMP